MVKTYAITGMTCSACSSGIERAVGKMQGVNSVEVSLMGKSMKVDFDETAVSEGSIFSVVQSLGYGIFDELTAPAPKADNAENKLFVRFILSICLLVPLMYVSMGHMFGFPLPAFLDPHTGECRWFALWQAVISAVVVGINYQYFTKGFVALIRRVPNMDTLVSLGSGVSFVYSTVLTVLIFVGINPMENAMNLHFESAAMILALVDVGKWLEEKAKKRTGNEIEKLLKLAPDAVTVERDGEQSVISASEVKVGDIVIVKQGEYVPVDGKIISGHSFVDKSAITGESLPVEISEGDLVTTAALNKGGVIKVRAEKVGGDTTLSRIVKMVREAGASKAPIQKLADKIAGVFVPAVCAIAVITFIIWLLVDGAFKPEHCVTYAISVLVVSCPCALGLATPVAIMTATGKAASLGVLYKDAESLQTLSEVNCVLLDKTATLTVGKPAVCDFVHFSGDSEELKKISCGIEKNSNHPLAKCIVDYCESSVEVTGFNYSIGKGATATYGGKTYYLGNDKLISHIKSDKKSVSRAKELEKQGKTVIYLADDRQILALFAVSDSLKEGAAQTVELLKRRGMRVAMLTGDNQTCAKAVADSVGIEDYIAEVLPEDKLKAVTNLQGAGGTVAMVGDGINDSPALKQSDVGIAIGSGTDVAIDSAGVVLVSDDVRTLDTVFDLSKATVRNIKQNLFWAFIYNVVMIPVAAGAFAFIGFTFNPMIAAACMSLSSLFVVCNALRLLLYKNKNIIKEDIYMKKIVTVDGMCCEHCAARVEKALSAVNGVVSADVKLKKKTAIVRSREEVSDEEIKKVITDAGYTVLSIENK
ncbi:MAG: heavy metal translocating P-type ATPase [Candidatus Coproplasma sp.]